MLLKKAGMVVLGAAAGVAALSGTAFAGDMPASTGHDHSWGHDHDRDHDRDHGRDHGHSHGGGNGNASARNGDCANFGDQLVGLNCINVQAPINQLGLLSAYDNSSDDDGGRNGNARTGGDHGHGRGGDRDGGNGNASAQGGDQLNLGNQLIGVNNVNAQLPINQLGILSAYNNAS